MYDAYNVFLTLASSSRRKPLFQLVFAVGAVAFNSSLLFFLFFLHLSLSRSSLSPADASDAFSFYVYDVATSLFEFATVDFTRWHDRTDKTRNFRSNNRFTSDDFKSRETGARCDS